MNVRELIEYLEKLDPEAIVGIPDSEWGNEEVADSYPGQVLVNVAYKNENGVFVPKYERKPAIILSSG